jgi:hypothetical protein
LEYGRIAVSACRRGFFITIHKCIIKKCAHEGTRHLSGEIVMDTQAAVQDDPGYKYGSLRYVDSIGSNFLFRGPVPTIKPFNESMTYDWDGLREALERAMPPGVPLPLDYMIMDVCLLHATETEELTAITSYFDSKPERGSYRLNDTYGTPTCYFQTPEPQRQDLLSSFDAWLQEKMIDCAIWIRGWLEASPFQFPVIVYVHCDGGCDRTAEIIGAYRLRYMQATWHDLTVDQPCGRPLGCDNYRALEWYAFWLNATQGFDLTGIGENDDGCYDADEPLPYWPCSGPGAQNCF